MKTEQELIDLTEAFVRGELSTAEAASFEALRRTDAEVDQKVVAHLDLMKRLSDYGDQVKLKAELEDIHAGLNIREIRGEVLPLEVVVKRLWAKHRFNVAVAASVAVFTLLSTLMFTGYFSKDIAAREGVHNLSRKIDLKIRQQNELIRDIANKGRLKGPINPGKSEGTGFAIGADYIMTNYHVIRVDDKIADSVYVQNASGDAFKARIVYSNPDYDVTILQINDPAFKPFVTLPYTLKRSSSDPAEDIFTVGYPADKQVYNKGYLSSATGFDDDSTSYQASIAVNPGNSGSPLLDTQGNIIGVVKANQTTMDGVAFATKSKFMLQAIAEIPADSLNGKILLPKKNKLAGMTRSEQVKKLSRYIFMVKAY